MSIRLTPPPERELPAARLQQRKVQLESLIRARQASRQARRRRWPVALGAVGAVAAVAIAVLTLLPAGATVSPAAAAVLLRTARAAAKQPATAPPGPGQFVYTKSESMFESTAVVDRQAINTFQDDTREIWIAPDGSGRIREIESPPRFVTSADRAAWIAVGKPDLTGDRDSDQTWGSGGLHYFDLGKLPTDPGALEQLIVERKVEGGPSGDAETFTIIADLLRETYAPPGVRAALYTIAAELPGVQFVGPARDQLGRPGTAVAYVSNGVRHELIFDPQTATLLGEQYVVTDPSQTQPPLPVGTVLGWSSYLSSGVVDSTTATP